MSAHQRNTGPMRASPRCGATTRRQTACQSPAVQGSQRCRMHGGNGLSGAPSRNKNAKKLTLLERMDRFYRKYGKPTMDLKNLDLDEGSFVLPPEEDLADLISWLATSSTPEEDSPLHEEDDPESARGLKRRRKKTQEVAGDQDMGDVWMDMASPVTQRR